MPQKNVFHKKINKKVNKQNIQNSENWLFDDVSEIQAIEWFTQNESTEVVCYDNFEVTISV